MSDAVSHLIKVNIAQIVGRSLRNAKRKAAIFREHCDLFQTEKMRVLISEKGGDSLT